MLQNEPYGNYYLTNGKNQRLTKMRSMYDLEEGKLTCRCLIQKWKFCKHVKGLADGNRLNAKLITSKALNDVPPTQPPTDVMNIRGGALED